MGDGGEGGMWAQTRWMRGECADAKPQGALRSVPTGGGGLAAYTVHDEDISPRGGEGDELGGRAGTRAAFADAVAGPVSALSAAAAALGVQTRLG
ncbi:hypothetical protein MTO96_000185 [Rhipicephalus appendiculatus]